MMVNKPQINKARLWQTHLEMAKIGATSGGGVGRLALTDLDRDARNLFISWAKEAELEVRVDQMGNIFARRPGENSTLPPVMTGSHLDTQPLGGRFDGAYGVLAGLEVMRAMNDVNVMTNTPLDVVVWTDEEGARFESGCMGVSVFTGKRKLEDALVCQDKDGITIGDELKRIGFNGSEPCGGYPVMAYIEAHIEQGPILENERKTIGIVKGAQGQRCFKVSITGDEGHAGTLPMDQRKDAFQAAARMAVAIDQLAFDITPKSVITVGAVNVSPNSRNTISGSTIFSIDSRCPDDNVLSNLESLMRQICRDIAKERNVKVRFELVSYTPPVEFNDECFALIKMEATNRSIANMEIYSGAGHDACHMSAIVPTGMIFVPCKDGISHNERESANPNDLADGCSVLLDVISKLSS